MTNLRTLIVILVLGCFVTTGCDFVAPQISKAHTEKKQLASKEKEIKLEERQAEALESIAASLERIADIYAPKTSE